MSRPELGPRHVEVHSEAFKFEPGNAVRALVLAMTEPVRHCQADLERISRTSFDHCFPTRISSALVHLGDISHNSKGKDETAIRMRMTAMARLDEKKGCDN